LAENKNTIDSGSLAEQLKRAEEVEAQVDRELAQTRKSKTDYFGDTLTSLQSGTVGAARGLVGLADLVTPGQLGKTVEKYVPLKETQENIEENYSPAYKQAMYEFGEAEGIGGKAKEVLQNPSLAVQGAVQSAPLMFTGGGVARGVARGGSALLNKIPVISSKVTPRLTAAVNKILGNKGTAIAKGSAGEGMISGGVMAEEIRSDDPEGTTTLKQDALSVAGGAGVSAFGAMGGVLARKLGLVDADVLAAGGDLAEAVANKKGLTRRVAEGAVVEGLLEELPQSAHETVVQNLATDRPLLEGIDDAVVMGTAAGGMMGGAANATSGLTGRTKDTDLESQGFTVSEDPKNPAKSRIETTEEKGNKQWEDAWTGVAAQEDERAKRARISDSQFGDTISGESLMQAIQRQGLGLGPILNPERMLPYREQTVPQEQPAQQAEALPLSMSPEYFEQTGQMLPYQYRDNISPEQQTERVNTALREKERQQQSLTREQFEEARKRVSSSDNYAQLREKTMREMRNLERKKNPTKNQRKRLDELRSRFNRLTAVEPEKRTKAARVTREGNKEYIPVMKRKEFRDILPEYTRNSVSTKDEMGMGSVVNADERGHFGQRTPSTNPAWAQDAIAVAGSVPKLRNAVEKAANGEPLGENQRIAVEIVADAYRDERNQGRVGEVLQRRTDTQNLVRTRQATKDKPSSQYLEMDEREQAVYDELDSETKTLHELTMQAYDVADENSVDALLESDLSDGEIAAELYNLIERKSNGRQSETGETTDRPAETAQGPEAGTTERDGTESAERDVRQEVAPEVVSSEMEPATQTAQPKADVAIEAGQGQRSESAAPDFEEMVKEAARWRGAALNHASNLDKKGKFKVSQRTTKGDLDEYLMRRYGIDETAARDVSNALTQRNVEDDRTADPADYEGEAWQQVGKPVASQPQDTAPVAPDENPAQADLPAERIKFVERKVDELGSIEAVDKKYTGDAKIDRYARDYARKVFGEKEVAQPDEKPAKEPLAGNGAQEQKPKPEVSKNTIYTDEAAEKAREIIRASLSRVNAGIDPKLMQAGITLAGYHIEKGARTFSAYVKAMVEDMGDIIKPHLKSWYMAVKYAPEAESLHADMDAAATVENADVDAIINADRETLAESLKRDAGNITNNNQLKKAVAQHYGIAVSEVTPELMKDAQEAFELVQVMRARDVVASTEGDRNTFERLLEQYRAQPNLDVRSSSSMEKQAYSTPAPIAYLVSRLSGITPDTKVYEPTAGNGMLLIGNSNKNSVANELSLDRLERLQELPFKTSNKDATAWNPDGEFDVVIMNPPFGKLRNEAGRLAPVKVDGYNIKSIDHLIAANALKSMRDNGNAAIIIGANKEPGVIGSADRVFFNWLYSNYNVRDHFEIDGDLYKRQGAGWPIRVILINKREQSNNISPKSGTIERVSTWEELYEKFTESMDAKQYGDAGTTGVRAEGDAAAGSDAGTAQTANAGQADSPRTDGTGKRGESARDDRDVLPGPRRSDKTDSGTDTGSDSQGDAVPSGQTEQSDRKDGRKQQQQTNVQGGKDTEGTNARDVSGRSERRPVKGSSYQAEYVARSGGDNTAVLTPANMAEAVSEYLDDLVGRVGPLDDYVMEKLGYNSVEDLHNSFMGLQVDAIASTIDNMESNKGMIIADQTGVGKGRQAAAIIRYAKKSGKIPVFVTVKDNLFTDMYRDLKDIGSGDIVPFILNKEGVIKDDGKVKYKNPSASKHKAVLEEIARSGLLPDGKDALFMTYSQIQTANLQRRVLSALGDNAVFILDEAHNVSGEREKVKKVNGTNILSKTGAGFMFDLIDSRPVLYLSATFAKRPDNMPIYYRTDIMQAVDSVEDMVGAMETGGTALQTVISGMLARSGQLFRRERSFDGITIETVVDTENREKHSGIADRVTVGLRAIVEADQTFHNLYVQQAKEELEAQGGGAIGAGNRASSSIDHTNFTSVLHNYVSQLLLGLKAEKAANDAIEQHRNGEKPVLALENTMGSFLAEWVEETGAKVGDPVGITYKDVLSRALERTRRISVESPNGEKEPQQVPLSALDPITRQKYRKAQEAIDALEIDDLPISPIDYVRNKLNQAGLTVAEITGRDLTIDYSGDVPVLSRRDAKEIKDRTGIVDNFNNGNIDALILNAAGSTGLSAHASEKFADQKPRHMTVMQASGDINILMQMLGRINRTGQVVLPKYTMMGIDIPAEKRPLARTVMKMKSLNANTSANTKSDTSVKAADILNKYGDRVVAEYLADNPEIATLLDIDVPHIADNGAVVTPGLASKFTGRLALLPVKQQREIYEDVEAAYDGLIDFLDSTGQNDLEPQTVDLKARIQESRVQYEGKDPSTIFGGNTVVHKVSANVQGRPPSAEDVQKAIDKAAGEKTPEQATEDIKNAIGEDSGYEEKLRRSIEETQKKVEELNARNDVEQEDVTKAEQAVERAQEQVQKYNDIKQEALNALDRFAIGSRVRLDLGDGAVSGVVVGLKHRHKKGRGNPYALSKIRAAFMVNSGIRQVELPMSQLKSEAGVFVEKMHGADVRGLQDIFNQSALFGGGSIPRETRFVATGNLVAGSVEFPKGKIVNFTDQDGKVHQGILIPHNFKNEQFLTVGGDTYALRDNKATVKYLKQNENDSTVLHDSTKTMFLRYNRGQWVLQVPKANTKKVARDVKFNDRLRKIVGDFYSRGNTMEARFDTSKLNRAITALSDVVTLYAPSSSRDAYVRAGGKGVSETSGFESGKEKPMYSRTQKGQNYDDIPGDAGIAIREALSAGRDTALPPMYEITRKQADWLKENGGEHFYGRFAGHDAAGTKGYYLLNVDDIHLSSLNYNTGEKGPRFSEEVQGLVSDIVQNQDPANMGIASIGGRDMVVNLDHYDHNNPHSRYAMGSATGNTTATVEREAKSFLGRGFGNLTKAGKLKIVQSVKDLPDVARGMFAAAWHGSPHRFDKFSTGNIGTGEGAQAYGHGLYFASSRRVAEWYKEKLSGKLPYKTRVRSYEAPEGGRGWLVEVFSKDRRTGEDDRTPYYLKKDADLKDYLSDTDAKRLITSAESQGDVDEVIRISNEGNLYQVELAPKEDEYLLWDRPLSEQSEKVKTALSDAMGPGILKDGSGQNLYKHLSGNMSLGSQQAASGYLHSLGIRGIKYLDGSSRSKGEGNYNYVIFNDADVEITALYSKNGDIAGVYQDGTIYLVADQIEKGETAGLLKHEGLHLLLRNDPAFKKRKGEIMRQFKNLKNTPKVREAYSAVPEDTATNVRDEEALAYLVQNHKEHSLVKRIISAVKAWMFRNGIPVTKLTEGDLTALAAQGIKRFSKAQTIEQALAQADAMVGSEQPVFSRKRTKGTEAQEKALRETQAVPKDEMSWHERVQDWMKGISENFNKENIRQSVFDEYASVERAEKQKYGKLLDADFSPSKALRATKNLDSVMAAIFMKGKIRLNKNGWTELVDPENGKGFLKIFEPLFQYEGGSLTRLWEGYAGARRARELKAQNRENNYSDEQIKELMKLEQEYNGTDGKPDFKAIFDEYQAFNKSILDFAESAGVIDPESRKLWESNDYIPMYRILDDMDDAKGPMKKGGVASQTSGIRKLKGGVSKHGGVLENMVMNITKLVDASYKNIAADRAIDLGLQTGHVDEVAGSAANMEEEQIREYVNGVGLDYDAMDEGQQKAWRKTLGKFSPEGGDIVHILKGGKRKYYRVNDPLFLRSLQSVGGTDSNVLKLFRMSKSLLTNTVTANPSFMLANYLRDSLSTWLVTGTKMIPVFSGIKQGIKAWNEDSMLWQMMAAGAGGGRFYNTRSTDVRKMANQIEKKMKDKNFSETVLDSPGKIWRFWQKMGNTSENANRLAVMQDYLDRGFTQTEAAYQAMDVMNFTRHGDGAIMKFMMDTVPFLNARIQGIDRVIRGAKENPGTFAIRGAMLGMASLALYMANKDREEYDDLPEWDKDIYWHFFTPAGHYRFPKPFEVGAIFGMLPERIGEAVSKGETRFLADAAKRAVMDTFAFDPMPQLVRPAYEIAIDRNRFFDMPIVGFDKYLEPEAQYNTRTPVSYVKLAEAMPDIAPDFMRSPKQLEHLVRGYTSSVGSIMFWMADRMMEQAGMIDKKETLQLSEFPVVKRFFRETDPRSTKYASYFYDMVNEADQVYKTVNKYMKSGRRDDAQEMIEENRELLGKRQGLNLIKRQISEINKTMDRIARSNLGPAIKDARNRKLQQQKNRLQKRAVEFYGEGF
jgi:hypothetical protein